MKSWNTLPNERADSRSSCLCTHTHTYACSWNSKLFAWNSIIATAILIFLQLLLFLTTCFRTCYFLKLSWANTLTLTLILCKRRAHNISLSFLINIVAFAAEVVSSQFPNSTTYAHTYCCIFVNIRWCTIHGHCTCEHIRVNDISCGLAGVCVYLFTRWWTENRLSSQFYVCARFFSVRVTYLCACRCDANRIIINSIVRSVNLGGTIT